MIPTRKKKNRSFSRWKAEGMTMPRHWTRCNWKPYCERCDKAFRNRRYGKAHVKETGHKVVSRRFETGERKKSFIGERNPAHKLTAEVVRDARKLWVAGWTSYAIARRYGVAQAAAHAAISGKSWKCVK